MIHVTRLHGEPLVVNATLIEFVESTPDTVISMATGRKVMIRESVEAVIAAIIAYHQHIGLISLSSGLHDQLHQQADDDDE